MKTIKDLRIKIFGDGATLEDILALNTKPWIRGFTTNPSLMRRAGVTDYESFAKQAIHAVPDKPFSLEVFSDDLETMRAQAETIASWGPNIYVKIPVTTTEGESTAPLVRHLSDSGVRVNVTAIFTVDQVKRVTASLQSGTPAIISVFAGRIADTGEDPLPIMEESLRIIAPNPRLELLWASPRELFNIVQADSIGCHIITVSYDLLKRLDTLGKDLNTFSLETVRMFFSDAKTAGYHLNTNPERPAPRP